MPKLPQSVLSERIDSIKARNIEIVNYQSGKVKSHFKCLNQNCDYEWFARFCDVYLTGSGCNKCSSVAAGVKRVKDVSVILERLSKLDIELMSDYGDKRLHDKHQLRCLKTGCNNVWSASLNNIFNGKGCPKCGRNKTTNAKKIKPSEIELRLHSLRIRGIECTSGFTKMRDVHSFRCLNTHCRTTWYSSFFDVWKYNGCPKCAKNKLSAEEKVLSKARSIIRSRLSNMFAKGVTRVNLAYDDEYMSQLVKFWQKEYVKIPPKPTEDIGMWNLDHIIPLSWFDPHSLDEMFLCWNHQNFQWLEAKENASKGPNIREKDRLLMTDWHHQAISKASFSKAY